MIIDLDGRLYTVPAHIEHKIVEQAYLLVLEKYMKLDKPIRLGLKPISRHYISKMEQELNKLGKDGKQIRPKDGEDPTLHYTRLVLGTLQEGLKDAILFIDTEGGGDAVAAFALSIPREGESGGSLSFGGDLGEWQDNGSEDVRPAAREVISDQ